MLYQDKDNSVQVSFISGCHRLTPILAKYHSLSFCRFFITIIQNILVRYLYLIWVWRQRKPIMTLYLRLITYYEISQIGRTPTTNIMNIDTEKELECSLRMAVNMEFSCKMEVAQLILTRLWTQPQDSLFIYCVFVTYMARMVWLKPNKAYTSRVLTLSPLKQMC